MMDSGVGLDGRMSGPETYARNMVAMMDGGTGYGRSSEGKVVWKSRGRRGKGMRGCWQEGGRRD